MNAATTDLLIMGLSFCRGIVVFGVLDLSLAPACVPTLDQTLRRSSDTHLIDLLQYLGDRQFGDEVRRKRNRGRCCPADHTAAEDFISDRIGRA